MSSTAPIPLPNSVPPPRFGEIVFARRFKLAAFVLAVGVIAAGLSLLLKPWFAAEARLLPPAENNDIISNLTGMIESSALNRIGMFTTSSPSDIIVEIMKSRRIRESVIRKFNLQRQYKMKNMDNTLKELNQHVSVKSASSGIVSIRVEDPSKVQAADMANFMVSELDRFNREVLNTRGKRMRVFLEERLADAQRHMAEVDATLAAYEQKHGVLVTPDENAARGMSDLVSRRIALQVRRAYVTSYSSEDSPEVRSIDAELQAFDRELGQLPEVKNEGQRLALDSAIQHKVFTLLSAQYEQARIDEMRDVPTVTVLDDARPPDLKSRPKRSVLVLIAMVIATAGSLGWMYWSWRRTLRIEALDTRAARP